MPEARRRECDPYGREHRAENRDQRPATGGFERRGRRHGQRGLTRRTQQAPSQLINTRGHRVDRTRLNIEASVAPAFGGHGSILPIWLRRGYGGGSVSYFGPGPLSFVTDTESSGI